MYELIVSDDADKDLDNIVSYLAVSLHNPDAAGNLLDAVGGCYDHLEHSPEMYPSCEDERLKEAGYRKAVIHNYLLIYRFDKPTHRVYVLRFFYEAQNYINLI